MVFVLLMAVWRLLIGLEHPSARNQLLAVLRVAWQWRPNTAQSFFYLQSYSSIVRVWEGVGSKSPWFYAGIVLGFLLGEPYALVHFRQFWESVNPYLQFGPLPEGAMPGVWHCWDCS
jgi:hypothetical protein